ncbi:MAG: biotin carboxylase N-terminal domain-containing protein [Thermodesulfobacteriota bacterium]
MKDKILIANRGEIALRIMQACQDLDLDYVVVYTAEDEDSEHVRRNLDSQSHRGRAWRISSYTDPNDILAVADHTGCTAVHPGYGFFSEDFRFARRVTRRERPLTFIGPSWQVIKDLGDKINTKRVANRLGIPTIPGTDAPIYNEIEAEDVAARLFLEQRRADVRDPSVLVKAAAGGGGMGIEEVHKLEQFRRVYRQVQSYAKRQFGNGGVLIEQCLRDYSHIEVQIVCSAHREMLHFGTRNCTIQSNRRQKRVEAAPGFDPAVASYQFDAARVLDQVVEYSLKLASHVRYDNVGTWEWIVSRDGRPYLLEVNTRIQVENDVSARISYIDGRQPNLIREQIRIALGDRIGYSQKEIQFRGASIELRLVAEDTRRDFAPWMGTITTFAIPRYDWSAVYTHVPENRPYPIPTEYDANLALILVWGDSMAEAKARAKSLLDETVVTGETSSGQPILTNIPYLREKLDALLTF